MEGNSSRPSLKRSFPDDDGGGTNQPPAQKRVRFPKGKKVKQGDYLWDQHQDPEDVSTGHQNPRLAAKERAMSRKQIEEDLISEESRGNLDISHAEVHYEDDETFVDDGIQIEPFNLTKEREEGYFDAAGNFVEYINNNEIKDAWLDSADVDTKFTGKISAITNNDDDVPDLSSEDIGKLKRRIADVLEPQETILQALRRLKGASNSKKEKMSAETKIIFDQLTEDAMKLLENGDYNVYEEKQESFQREAEGYEKLAQVRMGGSGQGITDKTGVNLVSNGIDESHETQYSSALFNVIGGPSSMNVSSDDTFDMFAEDDENGTIHPSTDVNNSGTGQHPEGEESQSDYVYDESSGYYYSSSSGYYYDPSSGLYCCAASGKWYSYNEETGTYDEMQAAEANLS